MQGVCVCAYGADEFPAFFTRHSGCMAPARADSPEEAARIIAASSRLQLGGGIVFGALEAPLSTKTPSSTSPENVVEVIGDSPGVR